jgi:hypothetical protein
MKLFTIFVLLLNLGVVLGADLLAKDVHRSVASESVGMVATDECPAGDHSDNECFDPCHMGRCHFGHCSVTFRSPQIPYLTFESKQVLVSKNDQMIEEPFLEGHRRPPKLS